MSTYKNLMTICAVAALALGLAACGGGGSSTTSSGPPPAPPMPDPQMACEDAGGRWNADMTCTSAAGLLAERQTAQRMDISDAIDAAMTAVAAVMDDSDDSVVMAADDAIEAARMAIAAAADLPEAEKAANTGTVDAHAANLLTAKESRMAAMGVARRNMQIMAGRTFFGIGSAPLTATGDGARSAAYSGTNDADITVTMDDAAQGDGTDVTQVLKATTVAVAANHDWEGKRYAASGARVDGTYEAVVYSDVGAPTMGKKFGNAERGTTYEYTLASGMLTIDASTTAAHAARVGGSGFDHTAGVKLFKLPSPNPSGATKVSVSGSFHGVSGTYTCTPGDGATCAAEKATKGYLLGLDTSGTFAASDTAWTFRPSNPEARVTDAPDTSYSSYGWWLHKSADGRTYVASAFVDDKGTAPAAISGLDALNGTATYMGGAAGQYALYSAIGGTNDAGAFTARATLNANFNDDTITGTIDNFMGADGESRDWSVALNKSHIGDDGALVGTPDGTTDADAAQQTVWTIGGVAARAGGQWSGDLKDVAVTPSDASGVPKVATGTFYSTYRLDGRMVGAFGANKQ